MMLVPLRVPPALLQRRIAVRIGLRRAGLDKIGERLGGSAGDVDALGAQVRDLAVTVGRRLDQPAHLVHLGVAVRPALAARRDTWIVRRRFAAAGRVADGVTVWGNHDRNIHSRNKTICKRWDVANSTRSPAP